MAIMKVKCEICGKEGDVDRDVWEGVKSHSKWVPVWKSINGERKTIMYHTKCLMGEVGDDK